MHINFYGVIMTCMYSDVVHEDSHSFLIVEFQIKFMVSKKHSGFYRRKQKVFIVIFTTLSFLDLI